MFIFKLPSKNNQLVKHSCTENYTIVTNIISNLHEI